MKNVTTNSKIVGGNILENTKNQSKYKINQKYCKTYKSKSII